MERKVAWTLSFAVGLIGGVALATGWYTATAVTVEAGAEQIAGRARPAGIETGAAPARPGSGSSRGEAD